MLDLRVVGGSVVSGTGTERRDLGVSDGKVVGLYAPGRAPEARETVEADQLLVLPGVVDAHFHCFAPAHPEREDFDTGTQAAAAGGVTTILEMPISVPPVRNAAIFRDRRRVGEAQAHVDFGLWAGGGATGPDIREMAAEGAVGYKILLYAPAGREAEFEGLVAIGNGALLRALRLIHTTGLPAAIHCEDGQLLDMLIAERRDAGEISPIAHGRSRPDFVEAVAVSNVLLIAEVLRTRIHFVHISSGKAVRLLADAKRRGLPITAETCPHYLLFDEAALERVGPFAKINPPLRPIGEPAQLWQGLDSGTLDIVASDHAPYTPTEKEIGWKDIFAAPAGAIGIETMAPSIWDKALCGEITLNRAVELLSERPSKIFGLAPQKGFLAPGSDADFVLFDPSGAWTVELDKLFSRSRKSGRLFEGHTFRGRIHATYVRGEPVFRTGRVENDSGAGRFVRPQ